MTFINSYMCILHGDDISKFQGWVFTPAIFHIGIFQLSLLLFSIIAILKNAQFKSACLIFFIIYTVLSSFTIFNSPVQNDFIIISFVTNIATALISYLLYKLLNNH